MALRDKLNSNRALTTGVSIGVIVVALIVILWQIRGSDRVDDAPTCGFFTTDNGATWFVDSLDNLPPYIKNGKEAVRAYLFKCGDGKPFVGYLERYTPQAKTVIEQTRAKIKANPQNAAVIGLQSISATSGGTEVKKPLDPGAWYLQVPGPRAFQALQLKCPNGTTESLEQVLP